MTITTNYLYIQDSNAIPADFFYANNSTDNGNNTGWVFNNVSNVEKFRLAESGAIKFAQESTATVGTVSRLGGAGQIEADILKLVADGVYTTKVSALTVRGRLINAAIDAMDE
jgi:hypothetical protein